MDPKALHCFTFESGRKHNWGGLFKNKQTNHFTRNKMRFLHLIRPVMCVLPEVASPDRKVSFHFVLDYNDRCHPMAVFFIRHVSAAWIVGIFR